MTTETSALSNDPAEPVAKTPQHDQLIQRLAALDEAIVKQDPMIRGHMKEIHKLLTGFEELVHFLTDEQMGKIVGVQQQLTNTTLVQVLTSSKSKTAASKKAGSMTMGDI